MDQTRIVLADLANQRDQEAVVTMMDAYASDPMGDGRPLSDFARENLITGLRDHPTTLIVLAMTTDDDGTEIPTGIAACFRGFSTFAAKPLIHVSDFYVNPQFRGQGIGRALLQCVEDEANASGCCKLTLEVQENNARARGIYNEFGFSQAVYVEAAGGALSMSKSLI